MAEGIWVALGAAIGVTGSILTTALNAYLAREKPDRYAASKILKEMQVATFVVASGCDRRK